MIFLRIASLAGIIAALVAVGGFIREGDTQNASPMLIVAVFFAILFAWSLRAVYLVPFEWARRYIQGVEGDHRHEWHSFRGWRVRAFAGADGDPWFPIAEIAPILELKVDSATFRNYGPGELGSPESAPGKYLSVSGLRRLVKYSSHRDAPALGLWLDREVLKVHGNLPSRETV